MTVKTRPRVLQPNLLGGHSPIDAYVGTRIRLQRTLAGMSQEGLGDALNITFQQVQKYERGVNRVSASRLFDISRVLKVPISYFYAEMPPEISEGPVSGPRGRMLANYTERLSFAVELNEQISKRETLEFVRAYYRIIDPVVRRQMHDLVKALAETG